MLQNIIDSVASIVDSYDERDPFIICKNMDIEVILFDFKQDFKGYQVKIDDVKIIIINTNLHPFIRKFVCAHELAHFVLHEHLSDPLVRKFSVQDLTSQPELYANYFASELLISDDEIEYELKNTQNYYEVASNICVPPEILDFKIRMMIYKGYKLNSFLNISGDFLKKYVSPRNDEFDIA